MPTSLPVSSCSGRTAASSTSTTRLDFSSITPIRVQVRYWVSMMNRTTTPIDRGGAGRGVGARGLAGWRSGTGAALASVAPGPRSARPRERLGSRRAARQVPGRTARVVDVSPLVRPCSPRAARRRRRRRRCARSAARAQRRRCRPPDHVHAVLPRLRPWRWPAEARGVRADDAHLLAVGPPRVADRDDHARPPRPAAAQVATRKPGHGPAAGSLAPRPGRSRPDAGDPPCARARAVAMAGRSAGAGPTRRGGAAVSTTNTSAQRR